LLLSKVIILPVKGRNIRWKGIAMQQVRTQEQPEQRMSWARAIILAAGLFFVAMILMNQFPGYMYTVFTGARLTKFEQGMLDVSLVSLGLAILLMVVLFLFDPKPVIPPILVAAFGAVLFAAGLIGLILVYETGHQYLPDVPDFPSGTGGTLFGATWGLQAQSIDLEAVSMIVLGTGFGVLVYGLLALANSSFFAAFARWITRFGLVVLVVYGLVTQFVGHSLLGMNNDELFLSDALVLGLLLMLGFVTLVLRVGMNGPGRDFLVWGAAIISALFMVIYVVLYTFQGDTILGMGSGTALLLGNVILGIALLLAFAAVQIWFLPVMIAERRRYMPASYLIVFFGLVPMFLVFLVLFAIGYPLVNLIHSWDTTNFLTVCAVKTAVPATCTYTQYSGYILATLANGAFFTAGLAAIYFWRKKRQAVILSSVVGFLFCAFAAVVIHTDTQLRVALFIGTAVLLLAMVWAYSTRHEFASVASVQLGCAGQWLVLGTVILVYLAGFSFFSFQEFFETEALGINYTGGPGQLHDAFWALLVFGGLALVQFILLSRRYGLSRLRTLSLWIVMLGMTMLIVSGIQFSLEFGNGVKGRLLISGTTMYVAGLLFVILGSAFEIFNALWAGRRFWGMLSFFTLFFFLFLSLHPLSTIIHDATLPSGIPYTLAADQELIGAWVAAIVFTIFAGSGAAISSVVGRIRRPRAQAATNGVGLAPNIGD
jgi:hypothetical protein